MKSRALQNLDDVQLRAVMATSGPVVVFAGAGSGKTRIITSRIAYLLEQGVLPSEILAVTFTNKAAKEMKDRVMDLNPKAGGVLISTFHSACCRWCREFGSSLGYDSNFSIYDEQESRSALKTVISMFSEHPEEHLEEIGNFIEKSKTYGWTPADVEDRSSYLREKVPSLGIEIYRRYQEYLVGCNAMDFGDLILNVLILLRKDPKVAGILESRYHYILVDEYQDTNSSQIELITRLSSKYRNIFVVGDDDQSIYSWRGAVASNILEFNSVFKDAQTIVMDKNYRSSACIVEAAGELIKNNITRASKNLHSDINSKDKISYVKVSDDEEEARSVVRSIYEERLVYPYNKVAIFYRTNSQSRLIEDELLYQGIPYQLYGALKFYERAEVKDILAYLKLMVNSSDNMSLKRIINVPQRGIGAVTVKKIEALSLDRNCSMLQAIRKGLDEFSSGTRSKLESFLKLLDDISYLFRDKELGIVGAMEAMLGMLDYTGYLKKKYPSNYLDKTDNIYELVSSVGRYVSKDESRTLDDWLQSIVLSDEEHIQSLDGVSIMTLHMAKGLEFDRVYIIGLEEGILPHRNNIEGTLLEEERRLMYVGMTRARKKLSLYSASQRFRFNQYMYNDVSRFISEIPRKYLDVVGTDSDDELISSYSYFDSDSDSLGVINRRKAKTKDEKSTRDYDTDTEYLDYDDSYSFNRKGTTSSKSERRESDEAYIDHHQLKYVDIDSEEPPCYEGQMVFHNVYGKGTVVKVQGSWTTVKLVVNFPGYGSRRLKLKDVKLV